MDILVPKRKMAFYSIWDVKVLYPDGSVRFDWTGKNALHNVVHDHGARYILDLLFENAFTASTNSPYCALTRGTYDLVGGAHARLLTDSAPADAFTNCAVGDWLYLVGGTGAAGAVTPNWYQIEFKDSATVISLTADISSNAEDMTKVMCVPIPMRRSVLYLGLDRRATLTQADTILTAEGSEQTGNGGGRKAVDPDTAAEWTVSYDSTADKYKALSIQETWTAGAADWVETKNLFLAAGYHGTANTAVTSGVTTSGQVLIASVAFPTAFTLGNGESIPAQGKFYLHADA